jgi:hypothetical protein
MGINRYFSGGNMVFLDQPSPKDTQHVELLALAADQVGNERFTP